MIYSTQHNKNTNEGPKTSIVFENLMLLPDNVFWNILKIAASNDGILPDDAFYQEFNDAETFDAQVNVVSKLIDDVCKYYLK